MRLFIADGSVRIWLDSRERMPQFLPVHIKLLILLTQSSKLYYSMLRNQKKPLEASRPKVIIIEQNTEAFRLELGPIICVSLTCVLHFAIDH